MFVFSHSQIFIVRKLFHTKISLTWNFSENNDIYLRAKVLHLKHLRHLTFALFLLANPHHVVTRSAFWDTDILILAIFVLYEFKHRIAIDSVWLGTIELTEEHCLTLIRIHAFKGNDYISSFFKGGKEKILEDYWEISTILNLPQNVRYQPRTA